MCQKYEQKRFINLNRSTHTLTCVFSVGHHSAVLALAVVDGDDLHHDAALDLVFQVQAPVTRRIAPVELITLHCECWKKKRGSLCSAKI